MSYRLQIDDDIDFEKIRRSGQCFRMARLSEDTWRTITGDHVLYIRRMRNGKYEFDCGKREFDQIWRSYFDLSLCYGDIARRVWRGDTFMQTACREAKGVRILQQDAWEMIVTFIISQRKSIPAIRSAVETLACRYGQAIETPYETVYTFPDAQTLSALSEEELRACALGYRAPYIQEASRQIASGEIDIDQMKAMDNDTLFETLQKLRGVGEKVANCVMLFGYHRINRVPVDVWILRIMNDTYGGENPFLRYGDVGGVFQQYAFYYITQAKKDRKA